MASELGEAAGAVRRARVPLYSFTENDTKRVFFKTKFRSQEP
jgi:hypothetical protein